MKTKQIKLKEFGFYKWIIKNIVYKSENCSSIVDNCK